MKNSAWNLLFLVNYILQILYMSILSTDREAGALGAVPLLLSSLLLIDITYLSVCNIRENKVITLFCGLLALDGWYLLLSIGDGTERFVFMALSPVIWFVWARFFLLFLFQGSGYRYKAAADAALPAACAGSLVGLCISERIFALMYGIQFLTVILILLFLVSVHRKRAAFVLKSEWKSILLSAGAIMASFAVYYTATLEIKGHLSNFGIYLPTLFFFISIHGIIQKERGSVPLSAVFDKRQAVFILGFGLTALSLVVPAAGGGFRELFLSIHLLTAFIYLCNIVLDRSLKSGKNRIIRQSGYDAALKRLRAEERLKTEFAGFLHDEVLQDLLSVKNLAARADRPDVRRIVTETLAALNDRIREQMQEYHPVMRKSLTVKENLQNLIDEVSQTFRGRKITVSLDCPGSLFLVEPYDVLVWRILKELLTNVYKHSDGNRAWITLTQENGVIALNISDDGSAPAARLTPAAGSRQKGILSVIERVNGMEGAVRIFDNNPHGVCIQITMPMKGGESYQHFIGR